MKAESGAQSERMRTQLSLPFPVRSAKLPMEPEESKDDAEPRSRARLLESALRDALGDNIRVSLTDARSVLLSQSMRKGIRTVRVHQLFLDAPAEVRHALGAFLFDSDAKAGRLVDEFVAAQDHLLRFHAPPLENGAAQGQTHDLNVILQTLNRTYFAGEIEADICWGQTGTAKRRRKRSITLGNYCYRSRRITIHPALDQVFVPAICVERVVHHELCHARHPAEKSASGRRILHGAEFRAEEARFAHAAKADSWIQDNLDSLLRYRARTCKSVQPPRSSASRTPSV